MKENTPIKRKGTVIPNFKSLKEEKVYWEARGPLAEGRTGRVNKPGRTEKRSSFLVIRLTGEELTHLRDIAAEQGLGPSTFARLALKRAIERDSVRQQSTGNELADKLMSRLSEMLEEHRPEKEFIIHDHAKKERKL
jgi:hypothetical protein